MINHRRKRNGVVYYWRNGIGTLDATTANLKLNNPTGASTTYPVSGSAAKTLRIAITTADITLNQPTNVGKLYHDLSTGVSYVRGNSTNKLNFVGGDATISSGLNANQAVLYVNSDITSDSTLKVVGNAILIVSGNRTDTKGTNLLDGTFAINSTNAIGSAGTISFNGGTLRHGYGSPNTSDYSSRFDTTPGQKYKIHTDDNQITFANSLSSQNSTLQVFGNNSNSRLTLLKDANCSGTITLGQNVTLRLGTGAVTASIPAATGYSLGTASTLSVNFSGSKSITPSTFNVTGTGALEFIGDAEVVMSGAFSYTGGTRILNGTLVLSSSNALGTTGNIITSPYGKGFVKHTSANTSDYSTRFPASSPVNIDTNNQNINWSNSLSNSYIYKKGNGSLGINGSTSIVNSLRVEKGDVTFKGSQLGVEPYTTLLSSIVRPYDSINSPSNFAISPDGTKMYCPIGNGLIVVDTQTGDILKTITQAGLFKDVKLNSAGTKVYLVQEYSTFDQSSAGNKIYEIDTSTYQVTRTFTTSSFPRWMALSNDGNYLFVSTGGSRLIESYNVSTGSRISSISLTNGTTGTLDLSPDGTTILVAYSRTSGQTYQGVDKINVNTSTGVLTAGALTRDINNFGANNQFSLIDSDSFYWAGGLGLYKYTYSTGVVETILLNASGVWYSTSSKNANRDIMFLTYNQNNSNRGVVTIFSTSLKKIIRSFAVHGYNYAMQYQNGKLFLQSSSEYVIMGGENCTLTLDRGASDLTLRSISGIGGKIIKLGTGQAIQSGSNTVDSLNILSGTYTFSNYTSFEGMFSNGISVSSGSTMALNSYGMKNLLGTLTLTGSGLNNGGSLKNIAGESHIAGRVLLTENSRINCDSGSLIISSSITGSNRDITFGGAGNIHLINTSNFGSGSITKDGTGSLIFSGSNIISGTINVLTGTLVAMSASSLGATIGTLNLSPGATFDLSSLGTTSSITKTQLNASGSIIKFGIGTVNGQANKLIINGNVNLSNTMFAVDANVTPAESTVDLLTYTGTLTGTPQSSVQYYGAVKGATLINNTGAKKIQANISITPSSLLASNFTMLTYQGTNQGNLQKGNSNGELKLWDTTALAGGGWGPSPLNNPRGGIVLSNTSLNAGAKTITMFFKMNTLDGNVSYRPYIGLGVMDSGLTMASFITAWLGANSSSSLNWFRIMSAQTSTYGAPVSAYTSATYNAGYGTNANYRDAGYSFPQVAGTLIGNRIIDNGTYLTYQYSMDQGATWVTTCFSGPYNGMNYTGAGFSSSPTRFGIYVIGANYRASDMSITDITIT